MRLFIFITMAVILPIFYIMLLNETKAKKNIILGVTLPYGARDDEAVLSICSGFKKWLTIWCAFLLTLFIPGCVIPLSFGEIMIYTMTWLLFVMILPYAVYTLYHARLKRLKRERGWSGSFTGKTVVDIKAAAVLKPRLPGSLFAPPVLICLFPAVYEFVAGGEPDYGAVLTSVTMALTVIGFYIFYLVIERQHADTVGEDSDLNVTLTRVRRHNWNKMWVYMSWSTGVFTVLLWLLIDNIAGLLIMTAAYTSFLIAVAMRTEFAVRGAQQKLTQQCGKAAYVDDDEYWINGMFYYNPNDRHLMINQRTGLNMTVNLARSAGKAIMTATVIIIAAMPFFGLFLIAEERTPVRLDVTDAQVIACHTNTYTVDRSEIISVFVMDSLPAGTRRVAGTGLEQLLKGNFSMPGVGACTLCLNPTVPPFICIVTADKTYVFGGSTAEETLNVYEALQ